MSEQQWSGIYPILYAFFDAHDRIDEKAMAVQVEHCITAGAHGIAILGLVTEFEKLDVSERLFMVDLVGRLIDKRVPYAVTVAGSSRDEQVEFSRTARTAGADWVILQPPPAGIGGENEVIRFFGQIADALDFPVAIQNNPVNLDVSLSVQGLITLHRNHPNISLLKGEGNSVDIARVIEGTQGRLAVFGGHGGLELMALLRSGGAGLIPAPDLLPIQVRIFELFQSGTKEALAQAEILHRKVLPEIVFVTRTIPGMICYGKRLMARKLGLPEPYERSPAAPPTAFGLAETELFLAEINAIEAELAAE